MTRSLVLVFFLVLSTISLHADDETILLPLPPAGEVGGAFGTRWVTELLIYNEGDHLVSILRAPTLASDSGYLLPEKSVWKSPIYRESQLLRISAAIVKVPRESAGSLHFSLRVKELSRGVESEIEVPVVRESELLTGTAQFLDVPVREFDRYTLRIYAENEGPVSPRFDVRLLTLDEGLLIYERVVEIPRSEVLPAIYVPSPFGHVSLSNFMGPAFLTNQDRVRVEVAPHESEGVRFWAFLTVTNNLSQGVTTITPQ